MALSPARCPWIPLVLVGGSILVILTWNRAMASPLRVELDAGEQVIDSAWRSPSTVVLLVSDKEGFALRQVEVESGTVSVIQAPKSFTRLRQHDSKADFSISPDAGWIAYIEHADNPTQSGALRLWKIGRAGAEDVSLRLPPEIGPGKLAWDADDESLYISTVPYLFPEQPYSIVRLRLETGKLEGVALKDNVDLISQLELAPGSRRLVCIASGFRGEYPLEDVAVGLNIETLETQLLHARAGNLFIKSLGDGSILLIADTKGPGARECWLWPHDSGDLAAVEPSISLSEEVAASRDGHWIAWSDRTSQLMQVQEVKTGAVITGPERCTSVSFSPSGRLVLGVVDGGGAIAFVELPVE